MPFRAPLTRLLPLLVLSATVAGCAGEGLQSLPPDMEQEYAFELEHESFYVAKFDVPWNALVRVTINVTEGAAADAWLAGGDQCNGMTPPPVKDAAATALYVTNGTMLADLSAGPGCIPIENSESGEGLAASRGPVSGTYRIELWKR